MMDERYKIAFDWFNREMGEGPMVNDMITNKTIHLPRAQPRAGSAREQYMRSVDINSLPVIRPYK